MRRREKGENNFDSSSFQSGYLNFPLTGLFKIVKIEMTTTTRNKKK
jgi:hypothetical protein